MMRAKIAVLDAWLALAAIASAQEVPTADLPLVLDRIISVPGADGRFDHMAVDVKTGRVFASVCGNDTVAVVDVHRSRQIYTIHEGLNEPQGVADAPDMNRIVISNSGDGTCRIFDGTTYQPIATVKLSDDADQVRYDASSHLVYVGYGDGAIGAIDLATNKIAAQNFEVVAHPESFQLEEHGSRIFVNLASKNQNRSHRPRHWKDHQVDLDECRYKLSHGPG